MARSLPPWSALALTTTFAAVELLRRSDEPGRRVRRGRALGVLAVQGAVAATELRRPRDERSWEGRLLGLPYDLRPHDDEDDAARPPAWWDVDDRRLVVPRRPGIGWRINAGALAARLGLADRLRMRGTPTAPAHVVRAGAVVAAPFALRQVVNLVLRRLRKRLPEQGRARRALDVADALRSRPSRR